MKEADLGHSPNALDLNQHDVLYRLICITLQRLAYSNKPILHHTVRGLVTSIATLAIPVTAIGAITILTVGKTIAVPTYGTHCLIKHLRSKRHEHHRRHQMETISRQWTTNDSLSTYVNGIDERNTEVDDIEKAIQASLITFRVETIRRKNASYQNDLHDDDSFDE